MRYIRVQACHLGNQMFRYMLAIYLKDRLPDFEIVGYRLPEFGLVADIDKPDWKQMHHLPYGHRVDIDGAMRAVSEGSDGINIDSFAQRLEYFGHDLDRFRAIFRAEVGGMPIADDEIAVHIRTGDILAGIHPDYFPLPIDFYRRLFASTGLRPVFVGQITDDDWYSNALRAAFPSGRFPGPQSALQDFQTLREARHKVIGVSSFAWLASWLSGDDATIHYPVAGLLNPAQRSDVDLRTTQDPRYRFYEFPVYRYTGSPEDRDVLLTTTWNIQNLDGLA